MFSIILSNWPEFVECWRRIKTGTKTSRKVFPISEKKRKANTRGKHVQKKFVALIHDSEDS